MRRVAHMVAFGLALSIVYACQREDAPIVRQRTYAFYFYESTDANNYVLVDGVERAIKFSKKTSNQGAVNALISLKWNVLYPNSKGVITLLGMYLPETHEFSLQHWMLPIPFRAYTGETTLEPGLLQLRNKLDVNDFFPPLGYNPQIYQQRTSGEMRS